jgi:hypothetical protein
MRDFSTYMAVTTSLKGGSGKSMFACALLDLLRRESVPVAAYDADGAIGSLADMHATRDAAGRIEDHQDPLAGVVGYNIRDDSRAAFVNSLAGGHRHVLHDVAGGALADLQRLFSDRDDLGKLLRALKTFDAVLVFFHLVTPDAATVESVARHLDLTGSLGPLSEQARHVAVLNRHADRVDQDFPLWFGYVDGTGRARGGKTRARLLEAGGAEMDLPALNDRTMALVKELGTSFTRAVDTPTLMLLDQQRVRMFTEDFAAAMTAEVRALFGLVV